MFLQFDSTSVGLVSRLTSGSLDPESWERFVYSYGPHFVTWCREQGLQDSDARDVAQEVLLRVARQIAHLDYDPQRSFRGWLHAVVRGAWADWSSRQRRVMRGRLCSETLERLADERAEQELLARINAQYESELIERASARVRRRVATTTWQTFELLALQGCPSQEVCERLNISRGTALAARCRVQKLLREEIEQLESLA
ncbi:MAG: RNA polymerase sigma factor [Planctomycetaceae bacterium]|jgi:RNA polymerase sigma-70 factor (ECF subfamily)